MAVARSFVQEFVIGFGFLSGLWLHVGVNPEDQLFNAFAAIFKSLNVSPGITFSFLMIPAIITLGSIFASFALGGWLGLIAVGLAFISGIFISSSFGVILLVIAIIMGMIAPHTKSGF